MRLDFHRAKIQWEQAHVPTRHSQRQEGGQCPETCQGETEASGLKAEGDSQSASTGRSFCPQWPPAKDTGYLIYPREAKFGVRWHE